MKAAASGTLRTEPRVITRMYTKRLHTVHTESIYKVIALHVELSDESLYFQKLLVPVWLIDWGRVISIEDQRNDTWDEFVRILSIVRLVTILICQVRVSETGFAAPTTER